MEKHSHIRIKDRVPKNEKELAYWDWRKNVSVQDARRKYKMFDYFNALMRYNEQVLKAKHAIANDFERFFGRSGNYSRKATGYFPITLAVIRAVYVEYSIVRRVQNYYNHNRIARDKSIREGVIVQMRKYVAQKTEKYQTEQVDWENHDNFDNGVLLMLAYYQLHEDYPERRFYLPPMVAVRKKNIQNLLGSKNAELTPHRFEQKKKYYNLLLQVMWYLYDYII